MSGPWLVGLLTILMAKQRVDAFLQAQIPRHDIGVARSATSSSTAQAAVQGLLFDMDGTLTDSDALHYEAYRDTLLKLTPSHNDGQPLTQQEYASWMSGNSNEYIVSKLFPNMPEDERTHIWKSKEARYRDISTNMVLIPGLLDVLDWCMAQNVKTIIVTNAPREDAVHTLKVLQLHDKFIDTLVIGNECARGKPHPEPYLEGLRRLGLDAADCFAFEDSANGLKAALAAGLRTVGICTGMPKAELLERGASLAIEDYRDEALWRLLNGQDL